LESGSRRQWPAPLIMRTEAAAAAPVGGDRFLSTIEALRVITLREAARFNGLSIDSLRRHHGHLFVRTSTNRIGARLIDALRIARPIESSPEAAERSELRLPGG
jgi:hypothetical protein